MIREKLGFDRTNLLKDEEMNKGGLDKAHGYNQLQVEDELEKRRKEIEYHV